MSSVLLSLGHADGYKPFHTAGWPLMGLVGGLAFVLLGALKGIKRGGADWKGTTSALGGSFLALNLIAVFAGIFLVFGPGGNPGMYPRANLLGFQILVTAGVAFYAAYTNLKRVAQAAFVLQVITALSLGGCFPWLNHNITLWDTMDTDCVNYFEPGSKGFTRCHDEGYLQMVRTMSVFALLVLVGQAMQIFVTITDSTPLGNGDAPVERAPLMGHEHPSAAATTTPVFPTSTSYTAPAVYGAPSQPIAATSPAGQPSYQQL